MVNQRLIGEIHLDDFIVSHTKDDILWLGNQEEAVEEGLLKMLAAIIKKQRRNIENSKMMNEAHLRLRRMPLLMN